ISAAGTGRSRAGPHRVAGRLSVVPPAPTRNRSCRRRLCRGRRLDRAAGPRRRVAGRLFGGGGRLHSASGSGLGGLRRALERRVPWLADRTDALCDWKQTSLLSVEVCRLRRWYQPGLLLIGDAAHTMSPLGGVGISEAIQDAAVTSNILGPRLRAGRVSVTDLA